MKTIKPPYWVRKDGIHPLLRGDVGDWLCNEQTGDQISDCSGAGNHLSIVGGVTRVPGRNGDTLSFDGLTGYVGRSISDYRLSDSLGSILIWFKTAGNGMLFSSADETGALFWFGVRVAAGVIATRQRAADIEDRILGTTIVTDDVWHQLVFMSTGSEYKIYVDAQDEGLLVVQSGLNNGDWFADTIFRDNIVFGVFRRVANVDYFPGQISDVVIYDRILSESEIKWLYRESYAMRV